MAFFKKRLDKLVLLGLAYLTFLQKTQSLPRILENNEKYIISWKLEGENMMIFDVTVETKGFFGFGLSKTGSMTGADIIVGWVDDNNNGFLEDRHGVGFVAPVIDPQQDYNLLSFFENSTHTNMVFSRKLNTCDDNDEPITNDTIKIIWSYGETDEVEYHGPNRGQINVNLLDYVLPEVPDLSLYKKWEMRTTKEMPPQSTTYWCTLHRSPNVTGKHHIIGFNAIIEDPVARKHTHHMEAYRCSVPEDDESREIFESYLTHGGVDCYYPEDKNFPVHYCESIAYGWAIGGELVMLPEKLGFPLVQNDYFKLEVHYDNPSKLENVQFDTGLVLYYTDDLREIDASRLAIASEINFTQLIPPNSKKFTTVAHCSAICTDDFPEDGVSVFQFLLHAHLAGREIKVRHFRNGTELPWIAYDSNYDFNFQTTRQLRNEVKILKGDEISLECSYDTSVQNVHNGRAVIGGRETTDEMCMAFLSFYPALESGFVSCNSEFTSSSQLLHFGIQQIELKEPSDNDPIVVDPLPLRGMNFSSVVNLFPWTDELRDVYQNLTRYSEHDAYCRAPQKKFKVSYPVFDVEYIPPQECFKK